MTTTTDNRCETRYPRCYVHPHEAYCDDAMSGDTVEHVLLSGTVDCFDVLNNSEECTK